MYRQKYLDAKHKFLQLGGATNQTILNKYGMELLVEDGNVLILINESFGGYSINEEVIEDFNSRSTYSVGWNDNDNRFVPEFINRVRKGEKISENKLVVEKMPLIAYELNAYTISEYDGFETLEIDDNSIENYNQKLLTEKFFLMMNRILYSDLEDTEIVEYIRMLAPSDLLSDDKMNFEKKLKQLGENCDYLPGFSDGFSEAKTSFETNSSIV